jgi:hypothetical protein
MTRWRQPGAGEMLQVFLLLSVFALVLNLAVVAGPCPGRDNVDSLVSPHV